MRDESTMNHTTQPILKSLPVSSLIPDPSSLIPHAASPDVAIYVDVSALEEKHLTGMGRFVAHLVQALARVAPLGLLTTGTGTYIPVQASDLEESDGDLENWSRRLLRRPRRALNARLASA